MSGPALRSFLCSDCGDQVSSFRMTDGIRCEVCAWLATIADPGVRDAIRARLISQGSIGKGRRP